LANDEGCLLALSVDLTPLPKKKE